MNHIHLVFCFLAVSGINYAFSLDSESIIGGSEASEGQFPYQISLQIHGYHICGGAILSNTFILTAAHCVINEETKEFDYAPYKVVANTLTTDIKSVNVAVEKVYTLSTYNKKKSINDIALLKLRTPLDLKKSKLQTIKLPSANQTYAGVKALISGYGDNKIKIEKGMEVSSSNGKLKYAVVDILSNTDCRILHSKIIPSSKICGKVVQRHINNKFEGICSGDSGGPLVYNNAVIGVVSSSPFGCNESHRAATYTRVSSFLSFIEGVMSGNIDDDVLEFEIFSSDFAEN